MKTLALLLTILLVPFLLRAQIVHIPDANFKAALVGNSSINTNGDDEIQLSEAEAYTYGISVSNRGIADMTGLEAFIAITALSCGSNQLTSLDVSANTALEWLYCYSNQLTSLDVSSNTALTRLDCWSNQLHSLNVRNGNNASIINCNAALNPALSCITVSDVAYAEANWTNIDEGVIFSEGGCNVYIPDANFKAALLADDAINTIDDSEIQYREAETYSGSIYVANLSIADMTGLEAFKSVTGLDCSANNLSQLVVRQNARIVSIDCGNNELGSLDVSLNPALETLNCASNQLKGLELSNTNNLRQLDCQSNQLEILDLSDNVKLTELYCQSNQLRSLDVKNGNNEQITAFDARNNPSLSCIAVDDEAYSAANWPNVDAEGLFNEEGCAVVYIPDAGFKAALLANTGINTNWDTEIQVSEAKAYTGDIQVPSTGISDMTGLEAFSKLTTLDCSGNQLSELDMKANELLIQLNCSNNQLGRLALRSNQLLEQLDCSNNQLSRLALRSNPLLEQLDCSNNQFELLDLRMNSALKEMLCQSNQLHSLDLRNGANEAITAFDATVNPTLICITVDDADYAESNWSGIDDGTVFSEDGCNVHIPDAIFKAALVGNGEINTNGDGEIQVSEAEAYDGTIDVDDQGIADMTGLEAFVNLTGLDCSRSQLTSLDVSANAALTTLRCSSNQLTGLDVSANTLLERLDCVGNQLTSLDVSANAALTTLRCSSNQLTSLDVSANTALTTLDCQYNQLTSLDVSANTALETLWCGENQLTSLDVSANTVLNHLSCRSNQLTGLDVSANTMINELFCSSNQLTALNLRNGNNHLITGFDATGNPSLACIAVSDLAFAEANWTNIDEGMIFSEGGCNVYIPDANFKAALLADGAINTNNDSEIQYGEAEAYTGTIEVANLGISDMTGLEAFKSITGLNCADNELTQLVLRYHTALESIDCSGNQLGALDMKANEALKSLNCASNQLTSLDVRNGHNTQITEFDARNNSSLNCISVDDANYSTENWTNIDAHTSFNGDCGFIADFVADETSGPLPLEVQFTDRSDNTATSWQWDFGDGNTSEEQSPSHTYTVAGTYTVILTISNGNKTNSDSKTGYIDILKGNQTITFEPLEHKALGNPDFELTATASSGLAVSYTSSDLTVATIDGNTVTIIGLGTTTITASQEGNDNYHAADPVAQTLEVTEITALTVEEDRILVYPNPASSTMILQFESGMRSMRMLNLNGQTVYEKHGIDKLAGRLEIDTSPFPPGEYIIRFEGEGKTTATKVLISR
jgi:Leucine-rich repeat (LRR) protein